MKERKQCAALLSGACPLHNLLAKCFFLQIIWSFSQINNQWRQEEKIDAYIIEFNVNLNELNHLSQWAIAMNEWQYAILSVDIIS